LSANTGVTKVVGAAPYIAKVNINDGSKFEAISSHQRKYNSTIRSRFDSKSINSNNMYG